MRIERRTEWACKLRIVVAWLLLVAGWAQAAEAPGPAPASTGIMPVLPVPAEAEASYQDLVDQDSDRDWLEEAIFTDISPLSVPELGIALPDDQDH